MLRNRRRFRTIAATALIAAAITAAAVTAPAQADPYPSWEDVEAAKANTAAAAAKVAELEGVLAGLQSNADAARAVSDKAAEKVIKAQDALDKATERSNALGAQADAAKQKADEAKVGAARIAAQQYRAAQGQDTALSLWSADADEAEDLLAGLGRIEKVSEASTAIMNKATESSNTSKALTEQAKSAEGERAKLQDEAQAQFEEAAAAQQAADAALAEQQAKTAEVQAQLDFLKDAEAKTSADYEAGVAAKKAAEEAARRAAEEAAKNNHHGGGGGGGGSSTPSGSGWAKPAYGPNTDGFGQRPVICGGGMCSGGFHYGFDIGAGCDAPVYAASSGTVIWAGGLGTYGNFVKIDHGDGIATGYAHNRWGGLLVDDGQWVNAGQQIAWSGTTGASTGCHVHFEVFRWGSRIDPYSFMADRGIYLG
ncbi:M23 family metallopeptidase [Agromyces humi]|uniref:M23 family metallopeptidase n=1 Tax=Agromyces humi TaxID=1766800 RepID=UPI001357C7CB|nr:M23 family metallopeptidase [Agromyces humi]